MCKDKFCLTTHIALCHVFIDAYWKSMMTDYRIAASLLAADFAKLGEEAESIIQAGADQLHFDAMDNHFVPNLSVGPLVCAALRRYGIEAPINVHLMANPIDRLIIQFAEAGATSITFHTEASADIVKDLALVRQQGCLAGLAFKPETSLSILTKLIYEVDMVLIMSVNPGFGGQAFIPASLQKIKNAREIIDASGQAICLGVDGGINAENIAAAAIAGAQMLVAGTALFHQRDYTLAIKELRARLAGI